MNQLQSAKSSRQISLAILKNVAKSPLQRGVTNISSMYA